MGCTEPVSYTHLDVYKRQADTLLVAGVGSKVDGSGKAAAVDIRAVNCEVTVASDSKIENIDSGLSGVSLSMGVPTKVLPGGSLVTQITFQGVTTPKILSLIHI